MTTTLRTLTRATVSLLEGALLCISSPASGLRPAVVPQNLTRINPVAAEVATATGQA